MTCDDTRKTLAQISEQFISYSRMVLLPIERHQIPLLLEQKEQLIVAIEELHQAVLPNPYRSERVEPQFGYPEGFTISSLAKQKESLRLFFPDLDLSSIPDQYSGELPLGSDGVVLIPKITALGRILQLDDPMGDGYRKLLNQICNMLRDERGEFGNQFFHPIEDIGISFNPEVRERLEQYESQIVGDVLILPFSFGQLYAGWSERSARWQALHRQQLPLGSVQVGCLLLLMPNRISKYGDLNILCSDELPSSSDPRCFCFRTSDTRTDRVLRVSYRDSFVAYRDCGGAAVVFLPEGV